MVLYEVTALEIDKYFPNKVCETAHFQAEPIAVQWRQNVNKHERGIPLLYAVLVMCQYPAIEVFP